MEDDEVDIPVLDGRGRVHGTAGLCDTSLGVWDDAVRLLNPAALRAEAQSAAWPLAASSFWLAADAAPACALEALAAAIFKLHAGSAAGRFDPACSGAEWWANVSDSASVCRERDGYGKVALHFDKDEAVYAAAGVFVHPLLATITHLGEEGAPTLIVPGGQVSAEGEYAASRLPEAVLVPPRRGRHVRFDGRWLHGVPEALCSPKPYRRVTFLVNIWIGHRPQCPRFPAPTLAPARPLSSGDAAPPPFRLRQRRAAPPNAPVRRVAARPAAAALPAGEGRREATSDLALPVDQTAEPFVLRLRASEGELRRLLGGGEVVVLRAPRRSALSGAGAAAAAVVLERASSEGPPPPPPPPACLRVRPR